MSPVIQDRIDASPVFAWALFMLIVFWTPLAMLVYWVFLR